MPILSDDIESFRKLKALDLWLWKENSISLLLQLCVGKAAKCGKVHVFKKATENYKIFTIDLTLTK